MSYDEARERSLYEEWHRSACSVGLGHVVPYDFRRVGGIYIDASIEWGWIRWKARARLDTADPTEVPWLLRIMETRSLDEIRDIAKHYPRDRSDTAASDERAAVGDLARIALVLMGEGATRDDLSPAQAQRVAQWARGNTVWPHESVAALLGDRSVVVRLMWGKAQEWVGEIGPLAQGRLLGLADWIEQGKHLEEVG